MFTYAGGLTGVPASTAPNILDKSYTITAEVTNPEGGAEGMIVTQGGRFGGYGRLLSKGELGIGWGTVVFLYNLLGRKCRRHRADRPWCRVLAGIATARNVGLRRCRHAVSRVSRLHRRCERRLAVAAVALHAILTALLIREAAPGKAT